MLYNDVTGTIHRVPSIWKMKLNSLDFPGDPLQTIGRGINAASAKLFTR